MTKETEAHRKEMINISSFNEKVIEIRVKPKVPFSTVLQFVFPLKISASRCNLPTVQDV